ncbi:Inner membrane protein YcdZ [Citrobacter freundii]|uniref:Inner membrane protein YcdZ n=1 Tax=Citrobacter freundii TaxID=546 RepID=A0A7G2ISL6_CITFR|nr:Inner membrane protein YcdZ [Citrobacter freundii]
MAVSLGLLSWAGFLGCTAYFACPQGGLKGLWISACTLLSGVVWALVIINGSALAPHMDIIGYVMTGIVAFLMCIQAKQWLLSFVPGTFYWRMCNICRAGRLATGCTVTGTGPGIRLCDEKQWSVAGVSP